MSTAAGWGRLVAQRRVSRGLTQQELAERAGTSLSAVRDLEQGRVREPRPGTADRIAAVLDLATPGGGLRVQVLGPLRVLSAGLLVTLGSDAQRRLLGVLALAAGQVVSRARLVEVLWGAEPPSDAGALLHTHVSRLRRRLGVAGLISTSDGGYRIDCALAGLDSQAFLRAHEQARRLGPGEPALAAYADAASLWRGHPIEDLPALHTDPAVTMLTLHRQRFTLEYADTAATLNRHEQALPVLHSLIDADPFNEAAHERMMAALVATGRQAAAVDLYATLRQRLADELGVDPAPGLRQLHGQILRGIPTPPAVTPTVVPADRLPARAAGFVGRRDELRRLDAMLTDAEPGTMPMAVISGPPGAGKTTLAVHWAHQVRDRFPDGQLYLNLRGFDPVGPPTGPAQALPVLLQMLRVPAARIPATPQAQIDVYRDILTDRRMLIVLDNVRDPDQVRPLLPGVPGCAVVLTSRDKLTSLVVIEGAHPVPLDLLSADEARELLIRRLGAVRIAAEPDAVDHIITRCARLPLALAIVAARAAAHPGFALSALASPLAGLDAFDGGDHTTQVRSVFSWSYQALAPDAARLFRLIGLHPGPDIAVPAAASLAGTPPESARPLLAELAQAHLLTEHTPGRYAFHDLLRAYATELAHTHDTTGERRAAVHRTLDHYLHTAYGAHQLLSPHHDPIPLAPARSGTFPECLTDHHQAMTWYTANHRVLLAAVKQAADTGSDTAAWQLAWAMLEFLDRQGRWHDQAGTFRLALDAAHRLGDPAAQAHAHRGLGRAYGRLGQHTDAYHHLRLALDLYRGIGDRAGQARTHGNLAGVLERQGRNAESTDHDHEALALYRALGDVAGQARTLNNIGWYHTLRGDHATAIIHCQHALGLRQKTGDRRGEANIWHSLGYAHHRLDKHADAVTCYQYALDQYREVGDRYHEADTLTHLGDAHSAAGDHDTARESWRQALTIHDELGHPDAHQLHAKLAAGGPPVPVVS